MASCVNLLRSVVFVSVLVRSGLVYSRTVALVCDILFDNCDIDIDLFS